MGKTLLGKVVSLALSGVMLVSAVPAFAEDFVIEEDTSIEEELMMESAQEDVSADVLIEDMEVVEAKNMYGDGKLWYSTRIGSFSDGTNSVYYYHSYPSSIGGWDEIPKTDDKTKEFLGYSLEENGEIISLPFNFEEAGTELFAVWGSNMTYKITLDANGGKFINSDTSTSLTCKDGTVLDMAYELEDGILPTPTGGPGDFLGYSDTPDGKPLTSYTVNGNATLYAVWEDYADCEHNWVLSEEDSIPASCTEGGVDFYVCTKCTEIDRRDIPATGHSFGDWVTKEATCTEAGERIRTCSGCGKTETETIPVTGHKWDSGKITKNPTTTSEGVKTYTCTVCSETKTEAIAKISTPASSQKSQQQKAPAEKITISKKPTSVKAKATKKNKATVSWKKFKKTKKTKAIWKKIKKIEVQYSTDKSFSAVNTKLIQVGKSKTKYTLKGLQKNTTYYVRVRYSDGTGGYSKWGSVKKVKTKKK